jgi:hypothetical protein
MAADAEHRKALDEAVRRVREAPPGPLPDELREELLRVTDVAVGDYADALFVRAMAVVDALARRLPHRDGELLRGSLLEAVVAFEKEEAEFRKASQKALEDLEEADARAGREARILFNAAHRAERLLLSVSLCVEAGEREAAAANIQELERMLAAGTEIVGWDEIDIFVAGAPRAGRSSLIARYASDSFDERAPAKHQKVTEALAAIPAPDGSGIVGATLRLKEIPQAVASAAALHGCEGLLLVYSREETGEEALVGKWLELTRGLPVVRVDNKSDVEDAEPSPVDPPPLATSARTGMNVELAFSMLAGGVLMGVGAPPEKKPKRKAKLKAKTKTKASPAQKRQARRKLKAAKRGASRPKKRRR